MKKNKKILGRWERLRKLSDLGTTLVIAIALLSASKNRIIKLFMEPELPQFPVDLLSVFLLFATLALIFLYIKDVSGELQMLKDYFEEFVPQIPRSTFYLILFLALTLGVLGYFSNRIIIYSIIFACLKLLTLWAIWLVNSKVRSVLEYIRKEPTIDNERKRELAVIENYYLKTPQFPLSITLLFASLVCFNIALLGKFAATQTATTTFFIIAYSGMIAIIVLNEIIYAIWRYKRDSMLEEIY